MVFLGFKDLITIDCFGLNYNSLEDDFNEDLVKDIWFQKISLKALDTLTRFQDQRILRLQSTLAA